MQILQELNDDGVKLEDCLVISPLFGRVRKLTLRFTSYDINTLCNYDPPRTEGNQWFFPSINQEKNSISLKLHPEFKSYFLESKNFFKINGTWTQRALLKRGDCLQLSGNRIQFWGKDSNENENQPLLNPGKKLNVLLEGETGTGKTSLAHKIHEQSQVKGKWVHLNLAAYSQGLIESELFGHLKGAFTGAVRDKVGAIEHAKEGTLFLDEIDSLSLETQTKLLTYLDAGEFRRVGSPQAIKVRPRFIFASGKPLRYLVEEGKMRSDFYYRISSGMKITLKSLRKEPEKILQFLERFEKRYQVRMSKNLKDFYLKYPWYGNYRQLEGHLEKKREFFSRPHWEFDWVDEHLLDLPETPLREIPKKLGEIEYEHVERTFQKLNRNERSTCEVLSISKYRLRRILGRVS